MRALLSYLSGYVLTPFYLSYKGEAGQISWLSYISNLQQLSSPEIIKEQNRGMKALINHVFNNSPYYRNILVQIGAAPGDFQDIGQLSRFPVLTKETIRNNMQDILAKNILPKGRAQATTGGSTGRPLTFWRDIRCRNLKQAMHLNFKSWYGYKLGDKQLYFWGAMQDYDNRKSLKSALIRSLATRSWFINFDDLKLDNLALTARWIGRLRPTYVQAYPNIICAFAQMIKDLDLEIRFPVIVLGGEQVFSHQRHLLREVFATEIFENYGSRELGTLAAECSAHNGMHYFAPGFIFEVVDDFGNPVQNALGNLIVTDLWNYGMPLIRYQVGDLVRLDPSPCPCGLQLPRILEVAGRVVDAIIAPNGQMIAGEALIAVIRLSQIDGHVQIVQKMPDRFEIDYAANNEMPGEIMAFIRREFQNIFRCQVDVEFIRKDSLNRDKSGKFRYVRSEVKSPYL